MRMLLVPAICLSLSMPFTVRAADPASAELVTRDHVKLNLAGAELIVRQARQKAEEMKLKVNIAVVDDGGHCWLSRGWTAHGRRAAIRR